jgi:GTP cyclohydrolase II
VDVAERVPTGVHIGPANARYLAAKAIHGAHTLAVPLPIEQETAEQAG